MSKFDDFFNKKKQSSVSSSYSSVKISVGKNIEVSKEYFPSLLSGPSLTPPLPSPILEAKPSYANIISTQHEPGNTILYSDGGDSLFAQQLLRKEEAVRFHNLVNDTIKKMAVNWKKYRRDYIELYGYDTYVKMYETV
jgi:hypothetical protein